MTTALTLPLRWRIALVPVVPALVTGAAVGALLHQLVVAVVPVVLVAPVLPVRARRRTLVLTDDGLVVRRDGYRLHAGWDDVVRVERRRREGLRADVLVLRSSELRPHRQGDAGARLLERVRSAGADTRVQIRLYDRDWRRGPAGARLRSRGVPGV